MCLQALSPRNKGEHIDYCMQLRLMWFVFNMSRIILTYFRLFLQTADLKVKKDIRFLIAR